MLRQRTAKPSPKPPPAPITMDAAAEPLLPSAVSPPHPPPHSYTDPSPRPCSSEPAAMGTKTPWLAYAISSGACAAFNGVFAKLTTTNLTTTWARALARALGLAPSNKAVEFLIRALFFGLNLAFNGIMWTLFTKALTRSNSTTRVSIVNTSANFMLTALLGLVIFGEALPPLWWVGAALLVGGNVVIGRREEGEGEKGPVEGEALLLAEGEEFRDMDGDLGGEEVVLKGGEEEGGEAVK